MKLHSVKNATLPSTTTKFFANQTINSVWSDFGMRLGPRTFHHTIRYMKLRKKNVVKVSIWITRSGTLFIVLMVIG